MKLHVSDMKLYIASNGVRVDSWRDPAYPDTVSVGAAIFTVRYSKDTGHVSIATGANDPVYQLVSPEELHALAEYVKLFKEEARDVA